MSRVCVSNLSENPCNLQVRTAGFMEALTKAGCAKMLGRSVRQKTLESEKRSLKSIALAVTKQMQSTAKISEEMETRRNGNLKK